MPGSVFKSGISKLLGVMWRVRFINKASDRPEATEWNYLPSRLWHLISSFQYLSTNIRSSTLWAKKKEKKRRATPALFRPSGKTAAEYLLLTPSGEKVLPCWSSAQRNLSRWVGAPAAERPGCPPAAPSAALRSSRPRRRWGLWCAWLARWPGWLRSRRCGSAKWGAIKAVVRTRVYGGQIHTDILVYIFLVNVLCVEKYFFGHFLCAPTVCSFCFYTGTVTIWRYCGDISITQTFWATWLTQWEVQLLRSGPFGFQVPLERTHKYEAVPGRKTR